ncbi:MAG: NAD(P)/FAD-dependent oxidoreductase [Pseudomonadota bacterium]
MLDADLQDETLPAVVERWLKALNEALDSGNEAALAACFADDCHWRDLVALTGEIITHSGAALAPALMARAASSGLQPLALEQARTPPQRQTRAGIAVIEAIVRFETAAGTGAGVVRLHDGDGERPTAYSLMTSLVTLHQAPPVRQSDGRDAAVPEIDAPNWLDARREEAAFSARDPDVLVVGGGHAGIVAAAEAKQLGLDVLIVDRMARIGDNWRLRYHSLKLHNQTPINEMPYLPFPRMWPAYIPKDKLANWLEAYVEALELNFWTRTSFEGATFDEATQRWSAALTLADGSTRTLAPAHIIMAASVSSVPRMPEIPTLDAFAGPVVHSSAFEGGHAWKGKAVAVLGVGTSAHDIAQDLEANGANVTMVQRRPSMVVSVEPGAQMYDAIYIGDGPPLADRDLVNASVPMALIKRVHKDITDQVRELDKPMLDGLKRAGFQLDFGEGGTGWPLKYRTRGGGYYFNIGCSELIIDGRIKLIQYADIAQFEPQGVRMRDGTEQRFDLVVAATGYYGQDHMVEMLFGPQVAARVGQVWGVDDAKQELANMWTRTPQQGLWFVGGAFSQARIYSKYLALQIKQDVLAA